MSRTHTIVAKCVTHGCSAFTHIEYERHDKDLDERIHTYRCARHSRADEVLSIDRSERMTRVRVVEKPYGKFWTAREDGEGGSGFIYGPGFRAFAEDFPTGTVLEVTARILPTTDSGDSRGAGKGEVGMDVNAGCDLDTVVDPNFTSGLSPVEYLDKLHAGELPAPAESEYQRGVREGLGRALQIASRYEAHLDAARVNLISDLEIELDRTQDAAARDERGEGE